MQNKKITAIIKYWTIYINIWNTGLKGVHVYAIFRGPTKAHGFPSRKYVCAKTTHKLERRNLWQVGYLGTKMTQTCRFKSYECTVINRWVSKTQRVSCRHNVNVTNGKAQRLSIWVMMSGPGDGRWGFLELRCLPCTSPPPPLLPPNSVLLPLGRVSPMRRSACCSYCPPTEVEVRAIVKHCLEEGGGDHCFLPFVFSGLFCRQFAIVFCN